MKFKGRALSVFMAALLTVGSMIPANLAVWAGESYITENCAAKNTYDEESINYFSEQVDADGKISYVTSRDTVGDGEYYLSKHGAFAENSGVDGSNAIRFYQVRGSSEVDKDVSYLRIFSSEESNYNWFVPESGLRYKVKISYKSKKSYKAILREVGSFGKIGYNDKALAVFKDISVNDGWNVAEAVFIASDPVTSLYIAFVTEDGQADTEAELYVDDVAVIDPTVVDEPEVNVYSSTLTDVSAMEKDGWKASYSADPQNGVAFTEKSSVSSLYECWGGGITRKQENIKWSNDWQGNPFSNMGALTYTGKKYLYFTLEAEYKFQQAATPWAVVSIAQPKTIPEMFYGKSGGSAVANPTGGDSAIGVVIQHEGHLSVYGKNACGGKANKNALDGTKWHKLKIIVTPGKMVSTIYADDGTTTAIEVVAELASSYEGGYIALMQNGVNFFRNIKITEENVKADTATYESTLSNLSKMEEDGWEASYSADPQAGKKFEKLNKLSDTFEIWSGITRGSSPGIKWSNDWNGNPFSKMSAATYTAKKYKYFTLDIEYKFESESRPWPVVTFNQPSTIPEMFYASINGSQVANPKSGDSAIGAYVQYQGHLSLSGKNVSASKSVANSDSLNGKIWHKLKISVTPEGIVSTVYMDDGVTPVAEVNSALPANYKGGYIALMLNGWSEFKNIKITEVKVEEESIAAYKSALNSLTEMEADGWEASYSADPQAGEKFEKLNKLSDTFEIWQGLTRASTPGIKWTNDWNGNPFSKMSAATYTAKKYKYFTLDIEYKFESESRPWPAITIGQPEKIPEMFYTKINGSKVENPQGGESAIGTYVQYQGHLNVGSRYTNGGKAMSGSGLNGSQWHKLRLMVVPGMLRATIYNNFGSAAMEVTCSLSDKYEGGYISLFLNGWAEFRNIKITEFTQIDMTQSDGQEQLIKEIDEKQCANPILISAKPEKLYDFTISAVTESGISYKIEHIKGNIYMLENAEPLKLTITYSKREFDYDPNYVLKYYFDWDDELDDFTATRTPNPTEASLEVVNLKNIWEITDGVLTKPNIDLSDTTLTSNPWSDFNIFMLKDVKFRNFELTVRYKHGKVGGFSGGVIFGLQDETSYLDTKEGGIFAMVESDARGILYGKSLRNVGESTMILPGEGKTNLPGYPKYDTTQIHTMRLVVIDGRVNMYIDDIEEPIIGIIPKDFYGHIALAVGNNMGWFDDLTIQPLDVWGNKITLAENENQDSFSAEDLEADDWIDNSEWGEEPVNFFYD